MHNEVAPDWFKFEEFFAVHNMNLFNSKHWKTGEINTNSEIL